MSEVAAKTEIAKPLEGHKPNEVAQAQNFAPTSEDTKAAIKDERAGITRDTQKLVEQGVVPKLEIGAKPEVGAKPEISQSPELANMKAAFGLEIAGVKNQTGALTDGIKTAHDLIKASPEERQKIFSAGAEKFKSENPEALAQYYPAIVNTALKLSPEPNKLTASFHGSFGALQDKDAVSDKNPSGIVATEFLGTGIKRWDDAEKAAFDTEKSVAKIMTDAKKDLAPGEVAAFEQSVSKYLGQMNESDGFAPIKDMPARTRPEQAPSLEAQAKRFGDIWDAGRKPENAGLSTTMVQEGNKLAFAQPRDMQKTLLGSLERINKEFPGLDNTMASRMLASAVMNATGERGQSGQSWSDIGTYSDARLKSGANPSGRIATFPLEPISGTEKKAFETALAMSTAICQSASKVESIKSREKAADFGFSVLDKFRQLRTD